MTARRSVGGAADWLVGQHLTLGISTSATLLRSCRMHTQPGDIVEMKPGGATLTKVGWQCQR